MKNTLTTEEKLEIAIKWLKAIRDNHCRGNMYGEEDRAYAQALNEQAIYASDALRLIGEN